jgi:hypothetical protein
MTVQSSSDLLVKDLDVVFIGAGPATKYEYIML